jgi:L-cysteine/cystine lyase
MDVQAIRSQIPVTSKTLYLNTGWSGPSPRIVMDRIREWLEYENAEGPTSPPVQERHRELLARGRQAMAGLINASPEELSLTSNTTEGLNIVINGIDWRQGDEIVTSNLEHPSVLVPAYFQQQRHGVKVNVVDLSPTDGVDAILERFAEAMTPRTRLLFVSHIQFSCGLRLPARQLADLAHDRGAWLLLDGAQGAGHVALDMRQMDCDFYAFPGHKWLLGPDGVGGLYVRRDLIESIQPWKVGGRATQDFDRQGGLVPRTDVVEKFELTTVSTPLWAGLVAAVEFHQETGSEAIEERALALALRAAQRLAEVPGVTVTSPSDQDTRSGLVTFSVAEQESKAVVEYLWQRDAVVARSVQWPPGIRFSTAFFVSEEEVDRAVALVAELVAQP